MESLKRKPFQGVWNIIRFNWHFYVFALIILIGLLLLAILIPNYAIYLQAGAGLVCLPLLLSLLISFYVYDLSALYSLDFLYELVSQQAHIVNINAGFDETSATLVHKFNPTTFQALDFYDPALHTEVSIKRARKAGLIYPNTVSFRTDYIPLETSSIDYAFLIFSLHEIRNEPELIDFLRSLRTKIKPEGKVIVVEHLRDLPNFIAYTIGFFHFYSLTTWYRVFKQSGCNLSHTAKLNPFVRIFVLE